VDPQARVEWGRMDINHQAPVVSRHEVVIHAPVNAIWRIQTDVSRWPEWLEDVSRAELNGPFAEGATFRWETAGLSIVSTIAEVVPFRRLAWSGPSAGITGIHVWTFTELENGVLVRTEESWDGPSAQAHPETLQRALDASLARWLDYLKVRAEEEAAVAGLPG
jgi:hypothetical protein